MLVLRKCGPNGESAHGFRYGYAGDTVEAPDWDPTPKCGGGLHGLLNGNGHWHLLKGTDWVVLDVKPEDLVVIDDGKCKFRRGEIVYRGDRDGMHVFAKSLATKGFAPLRWAEEIGDYNIMRDRIEPNAPAYLWALNIGDRWIMRDRITSSLYAFYWACAFGDVEIMRHRIRHEPWITKWRETFGWDPV